jgi:hypothetical protein
MTKGLFTAYRQAEWRNYMGLGLFALFILVVAALILIIYVSVLTETSSAGLKIDTLTREEEKLNRVLLDQQTRLARKLSATELMKSAQGLNLRTPDTDQVLYIVVPGLRPANFTGFLPLGEAEVLPRLDLDKRFTQSLWDWVMQGVVGSNSSGVTP